MSAIIDGLLAYMARTSDDQFERDIATLEDYNNLVLEQENKCGLCEKSRIELKKDLLVDHCHKTGGVRKLLCHSCNNGLGMFKDDIQLLNKAIEYLNTFSNGNPP